MTYEDVYSLRIGSVVSLNEKKLIIIQIYIPGEMSGYYLNCYVFLNDTGIYYQLTEELFKKDYKLINE